MDKETAKQVLAGRPIHRKQHKRFLLMLLVAICGLGFVLVPSDLWLPEPKMSPRSLSVVRAFNEPEAPESQEVRSDLSSILASVPCARVSGTFIPETNQLAINGHIPDDNLREAFIAALKDEVGEDIPVVDNLLVLPRPQCTALVAMKDLGVRPSISQFTDPKVIGETGAVKIYDYKYREVVSLSLQTPDYPAFVYLDYFTADGNVLHILPINEQQLSQPYAPSHSVDIGSPESGILLTVAPPFGLEMFVALVTSAPLYDSKLPQQESATTYLTSQRELIEQAKQADPTFQAEWMYFFVITSDW